MAGVFDSQPVRFTELGFLKEAPDEGTLGAEAGKSQY